MTASAFNTVQNFRLESDDESYEMISNNEFVMDDDTLTQGSNDVIAVPPDVNVGAGGYAPTLVTTAPAVAQESTTLQDAAAAASPNHERNDAPPRNVEAHRLAVDTLLNPRPRSNPRSRTPRRNPSPLSPSWNRTNVHEGDLSENESNNRPSTRFSSPLFAAGQRLGETAGGGGGTPAGAGAFLRLGRTTAPPAAERTLRTSTTPTRERPSLQGPSPSSMPSKRKVRRWNNDNFVGVASDLAQHSKKGAALAELFLKSEAEKAAYLYPHYPHNYRSEFANMARNKDGKYTLMRERFFVQGEVPQPQQPTSSKSQQVFDDGHAMFLQLDPRLRKVLVRYCHSGTDACRLVSAVEQFIVHHLSSSSSSSSFDTFMEVLHPILLEAHVVQSSRKKENGTKRCLRFAFDSTSPNGAFHRLLFHIISQFHGLESKSEQGTTSTSQEARVLTVSGRCRGPSFCVVDCALEGQSNDHKGNEKAAPAEEEKTQLRVR